MKQEHIHLKFNDILNNAISQGFSKEEADLALKNDSIYLTHKIDKLDLVDNLDGWSDETLSILNSVFVNNQCDIIFLD